MGRTSGSSSLSGCVLLLFYHPRKFFIPPSPTLLALPTFRARLSGTYADLTCVTVLICLDSFSLLCFAKPLHVHHMSTYDACPTTSCLKYSMP